MKARFLTRSCMDVWGSTDWVLLEPLRYYSAIADTEIVVPAGFVNDLASIPRFFRRVIPVNGRHRYAAIVHDWLYANALGGRSQHWMDRELADDIFLEAMHVLGVPNWKRAAMHRAVRVGGGRYWKRRNGLVQEVDIVDLEARTLDLINVHA